MTEDCLEFLASEIEPDTRYNLLSGLVVPRPIAWISTVSETGTPNLAPFSFFSVVSSNPPLLSVAIDDRELSDLQQAEGSAGGSMQAPLKYKDTLNNLIETGSCNVHLVSEQLVGAAVLSSIGFPAMVSEADTLGIELRWPAAGGPPIVQNAPAAMECSLAYLLRPSQLTTLVLLEVTKFRLDAKIWDGSHVKQASMRVVGRLGSPFFTTVQDAFSYPVPDHYEPDRHGGEPEGPAEH